MNQIQSLAVIQPSFYSSKASSATLDPTDVLLELKSSGSYAQISGSNFINSLSASLGLGAGVLFKSAAYTLTTGDNSKYVICSGGSWALTLPLPATSLSYRVRNDMGITGTTGTITITPTSATIDGASTLALLPGQEILLLNDGSNWRTFGRQRDVIIGTQDTTTSTASATILLPVGYRYFELQFDGVVPGTNGDSLNGQLSVNGGSTWIATGYYEGILYPPTPTTAAFVDQQGITLFNILPAGNNAAASGMQGKLIIYPGSATQWATFTVDSGSRNAAGPNEIKWNAYGLLTQTGPVNALKYNMSSGNIANSFLTVKGIV